MKKILFILALALFFAQCVKKELPIIEDPKPNTVKEYVPCYDSSYFNTSLPVSKVQFNFFSMNLPQGATYSERHTGHSWRGQVQFGCDTFHFEYGNYAPNLNLSYYYKVDSFLVDGNKAYIAFGYKEDDELNYMDFFIRDINDTNKKLYMGILFYNYEFFAVEMFKSFKFGW